MENKILIASNSSIVSLFDLYLVANNKTAEKEGDLS